MHKRSWPAESSIHRRLLLAASSANIFKRGFRWEENQAPLFNVNPAEDPAPLSSLAISVKELEALSKSTAQTANTLGMESNATLAMETKR